MANVQARAEELFQHGFEFRFVAGTEPFARHRRQRLIGNVFREVSMRVSQGSSCCHSRNDS